MDSTSELLNKPADELLLWVRQQLSANSPLASNINWHGIAEVSGARSHGTNDSATWAEIAVCVYARLAAQSGIDAGFGFEQSEMMVRATQIARHGVLTRHEIRDPSILVQWFCRNCVLTPMEAKAKSKNWRSLPLEDIRELRRIKNMLSVLEVVQQSIGEIGPVALHRWLQLKSQLP